MYIFRVAAVLETHLQTAQTRMHRKQEKEEINRAEISEPLERRNVDRMLVKVVQ